ncbi:CBS domain-containing protein [Tranquillimonas rosea]|uniref:CBS domain-containing protein n=1 Tax=Tranquillimonas rosea TaxID=641238 RepID=A0A1H9V6F4_9RHOB|nr:CBS domain-containing protein [Tranquillimonas rosea]SES17336.1 CBS domain-containing protein [Tranquillimonas rosea]
MKVHQILKSKSDDSVATIEPGKTVADAAALLSERRIGAVIVSEDGTSPMGILSERDIVKALGARGTDCLQDEVQAMMTSKIVSCAREDAAEDVLTKMTEGRFRHMPVIEEGRMVGLISIGDVVKARLSELAMERDALQDMVMGH